MTDNTERSTLAKIGPTRCGCSVVSLCPSRVSRMTSPPPPPVSACADIVHPRDRFGSSSVRQLDGLGAGKHHANLLLQVLGQDDRFVN
jgi:hypothetical protein